MPPCLVSSCEQWDVNSVPHPCVVGSLPTAPYPSPGTPLVNILFVKQLPKTESIEYGFEDLKMKGENVSHLPNAYTFTYVRLEKEISPIFREVLRSAHSLHLCNGGT